jgi:hypothetical protein
MTAIETRPGRGELYCGHCDLTIGGDDAKTPEELTALLRQRTAKRVIATNPATDGATGRCYCGACNWIIDPYDRFCRRCGARLEDK